MTEMISILFVVLLGTCFGSLLNVVVYRLPRIIKQQEQGRYNLWLPRSHCPTCRQQLSWYDTLPLLSWLLLCGRCRHCAEPIPCRYPLVEAGCMLVFLLLATLFPAGETLLAGWVLGWWLLALTLIDIEHHLLPDLLTLSLLWMGILFQLCHWLPHISLQQSVIGAMSGYMTLWLLARGYQLLRGKEALGMGDAKLLAALGAWLGWQPLPALLLLASSGSILWLCVSHLVSHRSLSAPFPFGPGLAAAGFIWFIAVYLP